MKISISNYKNWNFKYELCNNKNNNNNNNKILNKQIRKIIKNKITSSNNKIYKKLSYSKKLLF